MPSLLTNATTATVGSLVSHTGPCSIFVHGVLDGATVVLQASPTSNVADVVPLDKSFKNIDTVSRRDRGVAVTCELLGTYHLRAVLSNPGPATKVSVTSTQ
jgi:hypothetical protein